MTNRMAGVGVLIVVVLIAIALAACSQTEAQLSEQELVKRGEYLVKVAGCVDCHAPKVFGPNGPELDMTRFMAGAPSDIEVPPVPAGLIGPTAWGGVTTGDLTTWAGPWGVSFAANLTPHQVTGIGAWTEEAFIGALRTGKHLGSGRPILPPMPWQQIGKMTDTDLKAMFAYLKTLPPIDNMVPLPIPPDRMAIGTPQ